jgi:CxxC-x17-CxxC domain-containing protein
MGRFRDSKPRFGRNKSFGRRDSDRPRTSELEMHRVTCDKCGQECEVPFKPTGGKPVYCSECFRKTDRPEPRGRPGQSDGLEIINMKLDKILRALDID